MLGSPKAGRKGSVTPSPGQVGSPKAQRKRSQTPNPTPTSPIPGRKGSATPVPRFNCTSPNPTSQGQGGLSPRKSSLVVTELRSGRRSLPATPGSRVNGNLSNSSEDITSSGSHVDQAARKDTPKRPMSAKERGRSSVVSPGPYGSMRRERSRSRDRTWSENNNNNSPSTSRSKSMGPQEMSRQLLNKTAPAGSLHYKRPSQGEEVLSVRRDDSGRHSVTPVPNGNQRNTDDTKRPMTPRVQITPDRLLPDKPKIVRSQSSESSASESVNGGISPNAVNGNNNNERNPKLSMTSQSLSFSNTIDLEKIEAPPENKALNEKMERLFAEYLRLEKGLDDVTDNSKAYSPPPRRRNMSNSSEDSASVSSYSESTRTGSSSFQKSCSSSREDIISSGTGSRRDSPSVSNRTSPSPSGRASPIPNGGLQRKSLSQTQGGSTTPRQSPATKHSITPRQPGQPLTPRTARKSLSTTNSNESKPSSRPGTPITGRSSSLTRQNAIAASRTSSTSSTASTGPPQARRSSSSSSSASSTSGQRPITPRPVTPRQRTVSRGEEVLMVQRDETGQHCVTQVDNKPRERGRTPVRATPGANGPTARARSRSRDVLGDTARRGRDMSATRTPSSSARPSRDQCRTPTPSATPTQSSATRESRARTPTQTSATREGRARTPTTSRVRSASMPRPIQTASNNLNKTVPSPREPISRSREAWAESPRGRSGARTPVPQATQAKASIPARPASARGQPYNQRNQSQEDNIDSASPRGRGPLSSTRPSSARPAERRKSKDDSDTGGCFVVQSDAPEDRRSRSRTATNASRQRSASTTVLHRKRLNEDKAAQTSPPKDILPGQLALDLKLIESRMAPKPRKDDRTGRTRIPMPNHQKIQKSDSAAPLKRFDSGVDIATISPTESSIHGEEAWQNEMLCSNSAQHGTYSNGYSNTMENNISYGLSYNTNQDDDAEYF